MLPIDPNDPQNIITRRGKLLLVVVGVLLLIGAGLFIVNVQGLSTWDFRNNLWGPAHLLVNGQPPYDIGLLFEGSNSIWLPTIVGVAFPLGYLDETTATNLWLVLNIAAHFLLFALIIAMPPGKPAPLWLFLCIFGMFIYPPFVGLLTLGQISILMVVWLLLAARFMQGWVWLAALLIMLAAAKPQLLILAGPGLLVYAYRLGGWPAALRFIGYGGLWASLATVPLWLFSPDWVGSFLAALGRNGAWAHPSSLIALQSFLGSTPGLIAFGLLVIGVSSRIIRLWQRTSRPQVAMMWTLAFTVIVTPYVWSWDFVLLVPALVWTLFTVGHIWARLTLVVGYGLMWGLFLHLRLTTDNNDVRFWWVPWVLLATLAAAWWVSERIPMRRIPAKPDNATTIVPPLLKGKQAEQHYPT